MLWDAGMNIHQSYEGQDPKVPRKVSRRELRREDSINSSKIAGDCNPNNNSSLWLYGTESANKLNSNYKLNFSNLKDYEDDSEEKLERIGETEREYCSPKDKKKEELKNVNLILRKSHFKDIDQSSLKETKEMVRQEISRLRQILLYIPDKSNDGRNSISNRSNICALSDVSL